jgi:hypothetical protein
MTRQPPFPPYPAFPPFPPYPPYPAASVVMRPVSMPPPLPGGPAPSALPVMPPPTMSPPPPIVPPQQQGQFTVKSIPLAAFPDAHGGTGRQTGQGPVVDPASVAGSGPLQFSNVNRTVTTLLFELDEGGQLANVVPNWVGVAVPSGTVDFSNVHVFFHPEPAQAGYKDSEYPTKAGLWPRLFYYLERLGYQLDASGRNQIIVMPFLTQARTDTGIFPDHWLDILSNLIAMTQFELGRPVATMAPSKIVVSSYSVGIVYSDAFRTKAAGLAAKLGEVWDFDGLFSSSSNLSQALHSTGTVGVIKYQQQPTSEANCFAVARPRWTNAPSPPATNLDVHHLIRDFMFRHGCAISTIG